MALHHTQARFVYGSSTHQSLSRERGLFVTVETSTHPVSLSELTAVLKIDPSGVYRFTNPLKRRGCSAQAVGAICVTAPIERLPLNKRTVLELQALRVAQAISAGRFETSADSRK